MPLGSARRSSSPVAEVRDHSSHSRCTNDIVARYAAADGELTGGPNSLIKS
jgi:hypothetical protein